MNENEREEVQEADKDMIQILKDLRDASINLAKIRTAIAIRRTKKAVSKGIENTKTSLVNSAKQLGVDVVKNANKYAEVKEKINSISQEYEEVANTVSDAYLEEQKDSNIELVHLDKRKCENIVERKDLNDKKREYMQGDNEANKADIKRLNNELSEKKKEMIDCARKSDFDKVLSLGEECKAIINQKEELSSSNKENIDSINKEIRDNKEELKDIKENILEVKDMIKEAEIDFKENMSDISKTKESRITEIKTKIKMFDKIKMFFGKQIMSGVAKGNKVKEDILKPFAENIADYKNNKLPKVIEDMANKYQEKKDNIINKKDQFVEKSKDIIASVKNRVVDTKDKTISTVKNFGEDLKQGVVDTKDKVVKTGIKIGQTYRDTVDKAADFATATKGKTISALAGLTERVNDRAQKVKQEYEGKNKVATVEMERE